jgi:carboxylate-amine ligase
VIETAAALAARLQALCGDLLRGAAPAPAEDDYLVYNDDGFQACRFGIDAMVVDPKSYATRSLRGVASSLREQHGRSGRAEGMVDAALRRLRGLR